MRQVDIKKFIPKDKRYDIRDDLMRSLMLRIYPTGKKSWLLDYTRPDGRRNTIKLGDADKILSPVQARDIAREKMIELSKGTDPSDPSQRLTFGEFIEKYYEPYINNHQKRPEVSMAVFKNDFAFLSNKELSKINSLEIENWRFKEKDKCKSATVNRKITPLKAALNWAVGHKLLNSNPTALLKPLKEDDSDTKTRYLSNNERTRLLMALDGVSGQMRSIIMLAMNTGIRKSALFALKWEDVDFDRKSLRLDAISAKSRKTSMLPLNETALNTLFRWREVAPKSKLIFPSPVTGKSLNNINRSWKAILKKANIQNFRFHDLRHDFASRLVMAGVDLNTVRELLTHSDIKMTLRYAHLAPELKKRAVDLLD